MSIYREELMEHYKNPLNLGQIDNPTHFFCEFNEICGDEIKVYLVVNDLIIKDVKFEAKGCAISIACASILSESLKGKEKKFVLGLNKNYLNEVLGYEMSAGRIKCATLFLKAVQKALEIKK